ILRKTIIGRRRIPETDRIRNVPPSIIETILCLLPIQEAARTSILSRDWRYHWIKIPKLAFIEKMFQVSTNDAELSVLEQTFDRPSERKIRQSELAKYSLVCSKDLRCAEDGVPQELPTALVHLKYLFIEDICFVYVGLRILVLLIRSSPNLEKLKVEIGEHDYNFEECEANFFTQKNYLHIWLEHLKELEVMEFGNRDNELDFVKLILAKSPMLKKVTIFA
ncbi:F-box/FBD/LRR-repeat protein-like protein, partial [Tanacetum coccineum]